MKNYYKILGVKKSATDDELKRSYRKLALDYHPDRHGGDDTQFKEVSEAYAVLKDPAKRAEHNLDLKKEELKHKPRNAASHQTTTSADFGGKADPASQQGVWDDVQSNDQAGFRYRYNASPAAPEYLRNAAHWARPVGITLLAMAAVIIVGSYIIRSLSGSGVPTITPLTPSNNSQGNTPPTTDGGGFVNPTPSATPSCPTGQPSINLPQSGIIDNNTSDNQGRESYTVSGSLINDTTATINVNNVGFYFYSGTYDRSAPPDATKAFSDMITDGSVPIPPGVTVNWSATLYVPVSGSRIAASLEYAPGVGDQLTPEWYFTGNISQSCQPSPVSAQ